MRNVHVKCCKHGNLKFNAYLLHVSTSFTVKTRSIHQFKCNSQCLQLIKYTDISQVVNDHLEALCGKIKMSFNTSNICSFVRRINLKCCIHLMHARTICSFQSLFSSFVILPLNFYVFCFNVLHHCKGILIKQPFIVEDSDAI